MKEIFSDPDFTRVGYYESVLKEAGISCIIQNTFTYPYLFFPKLCVMDDKDYDAANAVLESLHEKQIPGALARADWTCTRCGETVPAGFEECWKCNTPRAGDQPA